MLIPKQNLPLEDPQYPKNLRSIHKPPRELHLKGDISLLQMPMMAIVGARECTSYGEEIAYYWAKDFAKNGICVVSGLALGIDRAAHQGALDVGGKTIAVLGCGLEFPYLKENLSLRQTIAEKGLLVSELNDDAPGSRWTFPDRNRIISGLSQGVLVVEASLKSGSLITARHARAQDRPVYAIPGNLTSPLSEGCHRLIQSGAQLATSSREIMEELFLTSSDSSDNEQGSLFEVEVDSTPEGKIVQLLSNGPRHIDELVEAAGMDVPQVSALLMNLEIEGKIKSLPGSRFCR